MRPYYEQDGIVIYHGDCRDIVPRLSAVDLVVTSPPYAQQRDYGFQRGEFVWEHVVPRALANVNLAPEGQMLVNLGLVHKDGEVVTYWDALIPVMRAYGFRLFGWYVWDQGFGMPGDWNGRLAPSHEWVFHFNRASRQPNKVVPTLMRKASGNGLRGVDGVVKSKSSPHLCGQPFKIPDSVIRIFREMARDNGDHPAPYPVQFAMYMLSAFDGFVLDPFMGGGTTLLAAKELNRSAIGIEIEERYCEMAAQRLCQGVLPLEMPA